MDESDRHVEKSAILHDGDVEWSNELIAQLADRERVLIQLHQFRALIHAGYSALFDSKVGIQSLVNTLVLSLIIARWTGSMGLLRGFAAWLDLPPMESLIFALLKVQVGPSVIAGLVANSPALFASVCGTLMAVDESSAEPIEVTHTQEALSRIALLSPAAGRCIVRDLMVKRRHPIVVLEAGLADQSAIQFLLSTASPDHCWIWAGLREPMLARSSALQEVGIKIRKAVRCGSSAAARAMCVIAVYGKVPMTVEDADAVAHLMALSGNPLAHGDASAEVIVSLFVLMLLSHRAPGGTDVLGSALGEQLMHLSLAPVLLVAQCVVSNNFQALHLFLTRTLGPWPGLDRLRDESETQMRARLGPVLQAVKLDAEGVLMRAPSMSIIRGLHRGQSNTAVEAVELMLHYLRPGLYGKFGDCRPVYVDLSAVGDWLLQQVACSGEPVCPSLFKALVTFKDLCLMGIAMPFNPSVVQEGLRDQGTPVAAQVLLLYFALAVNEELCPRSLKQLGATHSSLVKPLRAQPGQHSPAESVASSSLSSGLGSASLFRLDRRTRARDVPAVGAPSDLAANPDVDMMAVRAGAAVGGAYDVIFAPLMRLMAIWCPRFLASLVVKQSKPNHSLARRLPAWPAFSFVTKEERECLRNCITAPVAAATCLRGMSNRTRGSLFIEELRDNVLALLFPAALAEGLDRCVLDAFCSLWQSVATDVMSDCLVAVLLSPSNSMSHSELVANPLLVFKVDDRALRRPGLLKVLLGILRNTLRDSIAAARRAAAMSKLSGPVYKPASLAIQDHVANLASLTPVLACQAALDLCRIGSQAREELIVVVGEFLRSMLWEHAGLLELLHWAGYDVSLIGPLLQLVPAMRGLVAVVPGMLRSAVPKVQLDESQIFGLEIVASLAELETTLVQEDLFLSCVACVKCADSPCCEQFIPPLVRIAKRSTPSQQGLLVEVFCMESSSPTTARALSHGLNQLLLT